MSILKNIFTWWEGAGFGTWLATRRSGTLVGSDALGNNYYTGGAQTNGDPRRWVIYNGSNDASRVPPEWHGWLHHTHDGNPESYLPRMRKWEIDATGNLTGTSDAYRPAGALEEGGKRARATGDYQAWSPKA